MIRLTLTCLFLAFTLTSGPGCIIEDGDFDEAESIQLEAKGGKTCGGPAGVSCKGGQVCVDDTTDSCDPLKGDVDCYGVCVKDTGSGGGDGELKCGGKPLSDGYYLTCSDDCSTTIFLCPAGYVWFGNRHGCGCDFL